MNPSADDQRLPAEHRARVLIDRQLRVRPLRGGQRFSLQANVLFFEKKPAAERPWTERLWIYDLRTNQHFTLKQNPLRRHHLDDFVSCYLPDKPRSERIESDRFKSFTYDELISRDKTNLDITWLRDESLEDTDNLPAPEVIAREIVEDLTAALAEFEAVAVALEAVNQSETDVDE